ncbi:hypothetical protein CDEF62S_06046 [Castellaniella defragrans]
MKPLTVRVVNLASRADRREQVAAQFARVGVASYSFFEAVNGTANPDHPLFRLYDPAARRRIKGRGRDLKPSQLGCYASHYRLWQECVASGEPLIVVEDDAVILDNFPALLDQARGLAERWPLVWLHDNDKPGRSPTLRVGHAGPFSLHKTLKSHYRTVAYLLSPAGAQGLLRYSRTWIYPVDDAMCRYYDHGVESILIQPHCVTHDNDSASDITGSASAPLSLTDVLRREAHQTMDQIRRARYNAWFRLRQRRLLS